MSGRLAVIAAGGTGGHLFPAQALAEALKARGWRIVLASDDRVASMSDSFPAEERIPLSAATFRSGDPFGAIKAAGAIIQGVLQARRALKRLNPDIVVGFGGYPSFPTLVAAITQGRRTVIHEQNAVMGRTNRVLAPRVTTVACAFPTLKKAPESVQRRARVIGNPVRPEIRALYDVAYEAPRPGGPLVLMVTGGSQGARLLSELVPAAVAKLPEEMRLRLEVIQQARAENMENARRIYANATVKSEVAPFFRDMASRLSRAHLVIGRAGAGSVCEFAIAARPAILVPLAIALDDDQGNNARLLEDVGAAVVARENELDQPAMTKALQFLLGDPDRLAKMSAAARKVASPDAAARLADIVEETAGAQARLR
jgi:UDP-N-acetylglucosamine--N-acetylmuramyl-(pentapeptide) pyrophosphoryl-undecaprenol N-acetylglucosamine transferase